MSGTDAIGAARRRDNGRTRTTPYSRGAAAPAAAAQNETGILRSSLSYLKSLFGYDDPEDDLPPPAPAREPYPAAGMPDHAAAGVVDLAPSGLEAVPLRRETSQILDPPSHSQIFDLAETRRDLANTRSQMVAPPHMAAQPPALGHFPSAASLSAAGAAGGGRRTGNDLAASAGAFAMQPTLASSSMSPEPPSAPAPAADKDYEREQPGGATPSTGGWSARHAAPSTPGDWHGISTAPYHQSPSMGAMPGARGTEALLDEWLLRARHRAYGNLHAHDALSYSLGAGAGAPLGHGLAGGAHAAMLAGLQQAQQILSASELHQQAARLGAGR